MELPEQPEINKEKERFLKSRKLGKYHPNYKPLIPWSYIYAMEQKEKQK